MSERIFIIDSYEPRLEAAAARRQFSLSLAVGLAVLAVAAIVQFQPTRAAPAPDSARHTHVAVADFALAATALDRD